MDATPITNIQINWRKKYEKLKQKYKKDYKAMVNWNELWEEEVNEVKRDLADQK